jgi:hypothetical protein
VFAVLLDSRRLTDFLPKPGVRGETDYAPVSTAGGWFEIVVSALTPPDSPAEPSSSPPLRSGDTVRQRVDPRSGSRLSGIELANRRDPPLIDAKNHESTEM